VSNEEYTPTADEMRDAYASYCQETYNQTYGSASAEFDRFIETVRVSERVRTHPPVGFRDAGNGE
jgi:hypothetical protein